jgi:hypothetical protein
MLVKFGKLIHMQFLELRTREKIRNGVQKERNWGVTEGKYLRGKEVARQN